LVEKTNCLDVLVDQFAARETLEKALDLPSSGVRLTQRTKSEDDIAVAAASILARAAFVEAIEDFRAKTGLEIPLGSSAPEVVTIGRAIVRKWGEPALERIAKLNFKTTHEILNATSR
jgi:ribonuclease HIII